MSFDSLSNRDAAVTEIGIYDADDFSRTAKNTLRLRLTTAPNLDMSSDIHSIGNIFKELVRMHHGNPETDVNPLTNDKGVFLEVSGDKAADVARDVLFMFPNFPGSANIPSGRAKA